MEFDFSAVPHISPDEVDNPFGPSWRLPQDAKMELTRWCNRIYHATLSLQLLEVSDSTLSHLLACSKYEVPVMGIRFLINQFKSKAYDERKNIRFLVMLGPLAYKLFVGMAAARNCAEHLEAKISIPVKICVLFQE